MVVLSSLLPPQEGIRHEEPNTTVYINDREVGKGTFYVTESVLSWVDNDTQQGFSLEYPHISLHAVSRDEQVHPRQCLYIMIDAKVDLPDMPLPLSENGSENDNDSVDPPITEMQFAPDNTNNLDLMFQAMSACQALHPDPQDSFSDVLVIKEDIYEDAEEDYEGEYDEEVGAGDAPCILPTEQMGTTHTGAEAEEAMDIEAGQFEDAEEDP
ncbi:PREDICTED: methylosome subunit pICln isoform X1 [Cyphomyrmex costatus]|uniref:methylosome subunit pICln isoform X1 n=1 Tax=Cyphomyrmex costatus TaxID=456900 RepID=UPI0008523543|nr:PREDICTED: methylosome subunit pICln isoform X1 [Cyphomyrmex costatus]